MHALLAVSMPSILLVKYTVAVESTAIYKCRSIRISFRLGGLSVKVAIPFFLGGGGVRGSRNLGGSSASFKRSTTKYGVFLFHDPPPPSLSFWIWGGGGGGHTVYYNFKLASYNEGKHIFLVQDSFVLRDVNNLAIKCTRKQPSQYQPSLKSSLIDHEWPNL